MAAQKASLRPARPRAGAESKRLRRGSETGDEATQVSKRGRFGSEAVRWSAAKRAQGHRTRTRVDSAHFKTKFEP
jgi:hypothetical protein